MTRRIAVLLSGSGRSLENLFVQITARTLNAEIGIVISSNPAAFGLERAKNRGVATAALAAERGESAAQYSGRIFALVDKLQIDLVVLAGFLKILTIPDQYLGRVINIHPSLLPAFGGRGMYGHRVHEAVIQSGARVSGCTVHYVTNTVDAGPIIEQRIVNVPDGDTADSLAARVFEQELIALPAAIEWHLNGMLQIRGQRVVRLDKI
ncbi:MAG: phosphoribosylglycinamide formyltransferase [Planctomycetota bacterium]